MRFEEILETYKKMSGRGLSTSEIEELFEFLLKHRNSFDVVKPKLEDVKLLRTQENLSEFKYKNWEKLKFLPFIEIKKPLNLHDFYNLKLKEILGGEVIQKIEFVDRLYTFFKLIKQDLYDSEVGETKIDLNMVFTSDNIVSGGFRVLNIQKYYNNFNDFFLKKQLLLNQEKLNFSYNLVLERYGMKTIALYNASRGISAIDFFHSSKIFVFKKKGGSSFTKMKIKYYEGGGLYKAVLGWEKGLEDLSSGWNIIVPRELKLHSSIKRYVTLDPTIISYLGSKEYKEVLDNANYTHTFFTRASKYLNTNLVMNKKHIKCEPDRILKIINFIQSYPVMIDYNHLQFLVSNMEKFVKQDEIDLISKEIEKIKELDPVTSVNRRKKLKHLFSKLEGFENEKNTKKQIIEILSKAEPRCFYFTYMVCSRYRMYPNAGILNYQNYTFLRLILKGPYRGIDVITWVYKAFLEKHAGMIDEISKSIFFWNKINKKNVQLLISEYEWKVEKISFKFSEDLDLKNVKYEDLREIIYLNYFYNLIHRIGEFKIKSSVSISNDIIFSNGLALIEILEDLENFKSEDVKEELYWKRLVTDWNNFIQHKTISNNLYSFDATTSMVQIGMILGFGTNEKALKQCGIANPFIGTEIEDAHQAITSICKNKLINFIEQNKLEHIEEEIFSLINRTFIKTIHIPFGYGQTPKKLVQNLNLKHKNNKKWENLSPKNKSLVANFIYNEIEEFYKSFLPEIKETKTAVEYGYANSGINLGGEFLNMPLEIDISDEHIEYYNLTKNLKDLNNKHSYYEKINNTNYIKEKKIEIEKKIENIETRLEKFEDKEDLVKRLNISSLRINEKTGDFETTNKYKILYLNQNNSINLIKMKRCNYVTIIQNTEGFILYLTNEKMDISYEMEDKGINNSDWKITILWTHDCGSISLVYGDLLETSYKLALHDIINFYLDNETDPFIKKEYQIPQGYLEEREKRKKIWIENKNIKKIWSSNRLITSEI